MLERINNMQIRLKHQGGIAQQNRMIKDKKRALDKALLYSYQAANVAKVEEPDTNYKALINPDKTKQDYDDKIISIDYSYGFEPGTIFNWNNTGTKWLVYLQDLTELAYFRGEIRKCRYEIEWVNAENKKCVTYAAVRGPVETKITSTVNKGGIEIDTPNYSLNILIPKNADTLAYFKRYSQFYLKDDDICWRIEGVDSIGTPGIIELTAVEYYSNQDTDKQADGSYVKNAIKLNEIKKENNSIKGDGFIKPKTVHTYEYIGNLESDWEIDKKLPIEYQIDGKTITLKWLDNYSGQFVITYGITSKTIVVESLF